MKSGRGEFESGRGEIRAEEQWSSYSDISLHTYIKFSKNKKFNLSCLKYNKHLSFVL